MFTVKGITLRKGERMALPIFAASLDYTDVRLTTAIDLTVDRRDEETGRKPNETQWLLSMFTRVDLAGRVHIANNGSKPVQVEIKRHLFGRVESAAAAAEPTLPVEALGRSPGAWADGTGHRTDCASPRCCSLRASWTTSQRRSGSCSRCALKPARAVLERDEGAHRDHRVGRRCAAAACRRSCPDAAAGRLQQIRLRIATARSHSGKASVPGGRQPASVGTG